MSTDATEPDSTTLAPDEAFAVLGNETRLQILQHLGRADGPLSFSELRGRVGVRDSGQFNYHLDKLAGHFVRRTDDGYALRHAGSRVVEAVLSGAITEAPVIAPTQVGFACHFCGAPIEVTYREEYLELYCTDCPGTYGEESSGVAAAPGYLGRMLFPPAGVRGRSAEEVLWAASTWGHLELLSKASGVCPRCAAVVEHTVRACETHDASMGLCEDCDRRHAVQVTSRCTNCIFVSEGLFVNHLIESAELRAFVADHGIDPLLEGLRWGWDYEEAVRSVDPFEAAFTFTIDDDALTLTVDDALNVVEVTRSDVSEAA